MVIGNLPNGWAWATVGDVVTRMSNGISEKQTKDGEGLPVTRIETISQGVIDMERVGYLQNLSPEIVEKYRLQKGDILFSHINSDTHLGKTAIFEKDHLTLLHGMNLLRLQVDTNIVSPRFFHYFCNHYRFSGYFISIAQHAVNQSSINQKKLNQVPFPLPSLPEQERIVAKIEELFTQLEAGAAALKRVRAGLKRYKASMLKAAVEGRLLNDEGRMQNEGELPDGWRWTTVAELAANEPYSITDGPFGSKLKTEHYTDAGPRVIRLQNIGDGEFQDAKAHISQSHFETLKRHRIYAGDLVIAGLGESLPRACIIPDYVGNAIVKADCIRFKPNHQIADTKYLLFALNSETVKKLVAKVVHGIGRPRMNQQEIKAIPIPLPPLAEQRRIVAEVERRLSVAQEVESVVAASVARASRLRQSVLKSAFEGRLVP